MAAVDPAAAQSGGSELVQQTRFQMIAGVGTRLKDYVNTTFANRKPWSEVLERGAFTKPANLSEASARLRKNAAHFRVNYLIILLASVAGGFLMHPSSLFVLGALLAGWVYVFAVHTGPLVLNGRELSEREKFLGMGALSFVVVFFLTNVASVVFSAVMMGAALVAVHGACRVPDDLFIDDGEANQGLLSILTGGKTQQTTGIGSV